MREEKVRPWRALKYLLAGIVLCAAVGLLGFFLGRREAREPEEPEIAAVVLEDPFAGGRGVGVAFLHHSQPTGKAENSDARSLLYKKK